MSSSSTTTQNGIVRSTNDRNSSCYPCEQDEDSAAVSTLASMRLDASSQQQGGRGFCGAVATPEMTQQHHQPQQTGVCPTNNVGELVAKAKKAAASLWMILHAQVRRLSLLFCTFCS